MTRKFKEDFDLWAQQRIADGDWSAEEIEGLRTMIRADLMPGPDKMRASLMVLDSMGVARPAMIDDHEERHRLWAQFFSDEVVRTSGVNQRIRASIAAEKREAA